jgi:hypothetical protein
MTRDIQTRFEYFGCWFVEVRRMALNMDQITRYNPPPNPAKMTDCRAVGYVDKFGTSSWELDALTPTIIADLVNEAVDDYRDEGKWEIALAMEDAGKQQMKDLHRHWPEVEAVIGTQESFMPKNETTDTEDEDEL